MNTHTLSGTVTATPAYPGPQRRDSPATRPVAGATVTVTVAGTTIATTTTDADGRFAFAVPPGRYDVTAVGTGFRSTATESVTVSGPTTVDLLVDSGMR